MRPADFKQSALPTAVSILPITALLLIPFIILSSLIGEPLYPPISSTLELIIINRRFVSHIAFENTDGRNYLTLIVTHGPAYHAFHATSYPLHYDCATPRRCYEEAKKLNRHIQAGWNIGLTVNGSTIKEIVYLEGMQREDRALLEVSGYPDGIAD